MYKLSFLIAGPMTPANPDNYQQPSTSTSGDLFTKNAIDEGDSNEGEWSLEYAQKVCTVKPLVVKPPGMLPTLERKSILKTADSTVPLTDSELIVYLLSQTRMIPL